MIPIPNECEEYAMRHRGPVSPSILKRHPLTGELLAPVGFLPNGKCVWPIMGAEDPDDEDDKKGDTDSGGGDDKNGDDKDAPSGDDTSDTVSRADYDAMVRRMKAADKRASELDEERKKAEDAKKDDLTKAQDSATELEAKVEELTGQLNGLRLENAFLTANKHEWHDPEVALSLAQSKGYIEDVIDDDGVVDKTALKKALDRLSKEHGYLVVGKKKDKSDDGDAGGDDDGPGEPSGESGGGRSKNGKDGKARKKELQNRFPVLNR